MFLNFEFLFVAWPGLLILEFKSLKWGEVYILGHFVSLKNLKPEMIGLSAKIF